MSASGSGCLFMYLFVGHYKRMEEIWHVVEEAAVCKYLPVFARDDRINL